MADTGTAEQETADLVGSNLTLAREISRRLHFVYRWVAEDDIRGYAYLGLVLAAKRFDEGRGVPFKRFASYKAAMLAVDEMRRDGLLRRRGAKKRAEAPLTGDFHDPRGGHPFDRAEAREFCASLLAKLKADERRLVLLYYADQLTFAEIAGVFRISESAVSLRHKAVLRKLRKLAMGKNGTYVGKGGL
jgi:RNA polymerase sigma factor (sigma-70 family)